MPVLGSSPSASSPAARARARRRSAAPRRAGLRRPARRARGGPASAWSSGVDASGDGEARDHGDAFAPGGLRDHVRVVGAVAGRRRPGRGRRARGRSRGRCGRRSGGSARGRIRRQAADDLREGSVGRFGTGRGPLAHWRFSNTGRARSRAAFERAGEAIGVRPVRREALRDRSTGPPESEDCERCAGSGSELPGPRGRTPASPRRCCRRTRPAPAGTARCSRGTG